MGVCDEMIHSAATSGPPSDVDCESSRSESFDSDSEYDVSDSENDVFESHSECDVSDSDPDYDVSDVDYDSAVNEPGNSDTDVGLLRPVSPTENEIEKHKHILRLQQRLLRLKRKNHKLENEVRELKSTITGVNIAEIYMLKQIKVDSTEDTWSAFLLNQINNKMKKHKNGNRWNQEVIRRCIIWQARSPGSYKLIRKSGMLNLPCEKTLRSYLGSSSMDFGITDLIKEAFRAKLIELGNGCGVKVNVAVDESQ